MPTLNEKKITSLRARAAWIRKVKWMDCPTSPHMPEIYPFWVAWIGKGATLECVFFTAEDFE